MSASATLDGTNFDVDAIPWCEDGKMHFVRVVLGGARRALPADAAQVRSA